MATKEGEPGFFFFLEYGTWYIIRVPVDDRIHMSIPEALIENSVLKNEYMNLEWRSGGCLW